jgi:hypothetical protein
MASWQPHTFSSGNGEKTCGTNGPAHTDTSYTNVGHKNGQNKKVATEDQMGKYV